VTYLYQYEGKRSFVSVDDRHTTMEQLIEEQRVREQGQNPEKAADQETKERARRAYIVARDTIEHEQVFKALSGAGTPISVVPAPPGIEWVGLDGDDFHEVRQPVEFVLYVHLSPYSLDGRFKLSLTPFYSIHWGQWITRGLGAIPTTFFGEGAHHNKGERRGACSCEDKRCDLLGLAFPGKPFREEKIEKRREWLLRHKAQEEKAQERYQRSKQRKAAAEAI
jgi:hypothetical protein